MRWFCQMLRSFIFVSGAKTLTRRKTFPHLPPPDWRSFVIWPLLTGKDITLQVNLSFWGQAERFLLCILSARHWDSAFPTNNTIYKHHFFPLGLGKGSLTLAKKKHSAKFISVVMMSIIIIWVWAFHEISHSSQPFSAVPGHPLPAVISPDYPSWQHERLENLPFKEPQLLLIFKF